MSDTEYSGSENSDSDLENEITNNKPPLFKIAIKKSIGDYTYKEKDDADVDDSDSDNSDIGDEVEDEVEDKIMKNYNEEDQLSDDDHLDDDADEDDGTDVENDDKNDYNANIDTNNIIGNTSVSKNQKPKKLQPVIMSNDDDYDDDDDEYEENYLHKFDNELIKNYVNEFHPECLNHNYEEIGKMAIIIRNSDGIIIDPLHKTIPYLTKYEKARILGQRSKQIETGAKPLVKVPENIVDSYIIAELELKEKKIPFIIRRPIPGGACEYWHLKDLENIGF
jgi:DNA-directed RNA polymerase I, II, and III subunit RPABC2